VRLTGDLNRTVVDEIRVLLYRLKVLFLREQGCLDEVEREASGSLFGELVLVPQSPARGYPQCARPPDR
jgi:alpha-ketoglutarate-dependent taurine dioxygenase